MVVLILFSHWFIANIITTEEYSYHYQIKIFDYSEGNSTLIFPFPEFSSENEYWQNETFNNLNLEHFSGEVELIETIHGIGLSVYSINGGTIYCDLDEQVPSYNLSLRQTHDTIEYHWFYFEPDENENIDIHMHTFYGHKWNETSIEKFDTTYVMFSDIYSDNYEYTFPLENGWKLYRVYIYHDFRF